MTGKAASIASLAFGFWLQGQCAAQELSLQDSTRPPSERRGIGSLDDPPLAYGTEPFLDPVGALRQRVIEGKEQLDFDKDTGYLRSVLASLRLSPKSQMLVYAKNSVQARLISPANPRALYFSDDVVVGYIRGAPFLEFAALDPKKGIQFYTLAQTESGAPRVARGSDCLRCHISLATMDVPGLLLRSVPTFGNGFTAPQLGNFNPDHRTPFSERWGGWHVTGELGGMEHMGNLLLTAGGDPGRQVTTRGISLTSVADRFDQRGYLTPFSDVVALMTFEHQKQMTNLLVRIGWDARQVLALPQTEENRQVVAALLESNAREFVDYLLFVDEAPLPNAVGPSTFATEFASRGPFDTQGRSLRQFDLKRRLMRYSCSYMIYSKAFDELPEEARTAVYQRLWNSLNGVDQSAAARKLSAADRRAVLEILRATKSGLPEYFRTDPAPVRPGRTAAR